MTTNERKPGEPERKRSEAEPAPKEEVASSADHDVPDEEVIEKTLPEPADTEKRTPDRAA